MTSMTGTVHPIRIVGDPVLHTPCTEVTRFDAELEQLIADMFASMYAAEGVGLAANQIGVDLRVFVYDCPDQTEERQVGHVVNPTLVPSAFHKTTTVAHDEGCLSVPGQYAEIPRIYPATVAGFDLTGAPITITGTGLLARCFRHEVDHLDGKLYIDYLEPDHREDLISAVLRQE